MDEAKFNLRDKVRISISSTPGEVVGVAVYLSAEPSYLVRYVTSQGDATETWWTEGALVGA